MGLLRTSSRPLVPARLIILAILGGAFYARSFSNYFVADDYNFLGRLQLKDSLSYFSHSWGYGNEYRPLLPISYALDSLVSGTSPAAFHVTNTAAHIASSLLLGLLAIRLGFSVQVSILSVCLFLVSPVTHESFVWISGRPVVACGAIVLASAWAFVKSESGSIIWYSISVAFFCLALLFYEGAVVLPFLLCIMIFRLPASHRRRRWLLAAPFFALLLVYIVFWEFFFHWRITRFPVETSSVGMLHSLWWMFRSVFFGSTYLVPSIVYLLLLILLAARRPLLTGSLILAMICAFLPFLLVQGFADRFAYLSAAAGALLISEMLNSMKGRGRFAGILFWLMSCGLVAYFSVGMQRRITDWKQGGEIARTIALEVNLAEPVVTSGSQFCIAGVPQMNGNAYVFVTGLEPAIQRLYPVPIHVRKSPPGIARLQGQLNSQT